MALSFKKLAAVAALKAVNDLSDAPLSDAAQIATVEAKGLEALASLKAEAKAEEAAFLATPAGIRKLMIAKRAAQARLMSCAGLASMTGDVSTVQARRGFKITEGKKGETRRELTPAQVCKDLTDLLSQPGALKHELAQYNPGVKSAKPAPAALLALRQLEAIVKANVLLKTAMAKNQGSEMKVAKAA